MPERNLLSVRDNRPHYVPRQEYLQGLNIASREPSKKLPKRFASEEDAVKAYQRGDIQIDDPIRIG